MKTLSNVVVWDADGVLLEAFDENGEFIWTKTVEADLGLSPRLISEEIFGPNWFEVLRGKRETLRHFQEAFDRLKIGMQAQTFIDYWLARDTRVNEKVAAYLESYPSYIGTNQEKLRAGRLARIFQKTVRKVYASSDIGFLKPEKEFYTFIEKDLDLPPENICFIDDMLPNVEAAQARGWQAHQFKDIKGLQELLKENFSEKQWSGTLF